MARLESTLPGPTKLQGVYLGSAVPTVVQLIQGLPGRQLLGRGLSPGRCRMLPVE